MLTLCLMSLATFYVQNGIVYVVMYMYIVYRIRISYTGLHQNSGLQQVHSYSNPICSDLRSIATYVVYIITLMYVVYVCSDDVCM